MKSAVLELIQIQNTAFKVNSRRPKTINEADNPTVISRLDDHLNRLQSLLELLDGCRVLVVGAGGLGGHILKLLGMSGVKDIHLVDMDTLELSNLNRQILFRESDVGKYKAAVAANRINKDLANFGVVVTHHNKKIQDCPVSFYRQFNAVISGLDNIEARRCINSALCDLVEVHRNPISGELEIDPSSVVPMIDGGTEGFLGHCRIILPGSTSCFECSLDAFAPQQNYALCTLVDQPRLPEHCIEYALVVQWGRDRQTELFDADCAEHLTWLYDQARRRAQEFHIDGVTQQLTLGVAKHIVPAIASSNQIIASLCVNETLKILLGNYPITTTFIMYNGAHGCTISAAYLHKIPDCPVCSYKYLFGAEVKLLTSTTMRQLVKEIIPAKFNIENLSLFSGVRTLYMDLPQYNEPQRMDKTIKELQAEGVLSTHSEQIFSVEAKSLSRNCRVRVKLIDSDDLAENTNNEPQDLESTQV